jgi:cation diffusion facilitator CzcD-associated flavoprotein CzcO
LYNSWCIQSYPWVESDFEHTEYIEKKWDLGKDIEYSKYVESAVFNEERKQWLIECADNTLVYARWFIPAVGFAARKYTPDVKGLSSFKVTSATLPTGHNMESISRTSASLLSGLEPAVSKSANKLDPLRPT